MSNLRMKGRQTNSTASKIAYSQIYAIKVAIFLDIVQNVIHHHRTDAESSIRI